MATFSFSIKVDKDGPDDYATVLVTVPTEMRVDLFLNKLGLAETITRMVSFEENLVVRSALGRPIDYHIHYISKKKKNKLRDNQMVSFLRWTHVVSCESYVIIFILESHNL